jgi:hypothetical protein
MVRDYCGNLSQAVKRQREIMQAVKTTPHINQGRGEVSFGTLLHEILLRLCHVSYLAHWKSFNQRSDVLISRKLEHAGHVTPAAHDRAYHFFLAKHLVKGVKEIM